MQIGSLGEGDDPANAAAAAAAAAESTVGVVLIWNRILEPETTSGFHNTTPVDPSFFHTKLVVEEEDADNIENPPLLLLRLSEVDGVPNGNAANAFAVEVKVGTAAAAGGGGE